MSDDSQEKKHSATGKHTFQLRRRGIVMRSRDLSGGLILAATVLMLFVLSSEIKSTLQSDFTLSFGSIHHILDHENLSYIIHRVVIKNVELILPMFLVSIVVTILSTFLFGGWNFTLDVLNFNFSKMNPINNLQRLFAPKHAIIEIIKSMIKAFFFLGILISFIISNKHIIFNLSNKSTITALSTCASLAKHFTIILCCSLIFTILFDVIYNFFKYQNQSKMTTQEIKDEHKDTEGSDTTKRAIRSKQIALIKQRIMQAVPKADVIITNPTHYAVALRYNREKDAATKVLAKGKGFIAQQIRLIAVMNSVEIYQAPALARAIYFTTKVGHEVHPELYRAVAIVLSYVYQLKNYQMGTGKHPQFVEDLDIPDSFIYRE